MDVATLVSYAVAAIFALLGAACVFLVIAQLPGGWIMLGLAALVEWLDRYYRPEGDRQTFDWWVLGGSLALLLIGEVVEFVAGAAGARRAGSSRRGMWGALLGGVLGAFIFTPIFWFLPLVGALAGAILGTFVGAVVGELSAERATLRGSMKPAWGATVGRVTGTLGKLAVSVVTWIMLSVSAFV